TLSGAATLPTTDGSGIATFSNLSIDLTGSNKKLTATSGAGSGVSNQFSITAGAVTMLTFTQPPTDTVAGVAISPLITVRALDSFGNNVSGASIAMTLTAGTGPLNGTTPRTTNPGGNATFNDLSINVTGSKKLTASLG